MISEQTVLDAQWYAAIKATETETERRRPFMLLRPAIYPDGDQWCALHGENLQEGVAGFGDTPEAAARDFDRNWSSQTLQERKK